MKHFISLLFLCIGLQWVGAQVEGSQVNGRVTSSKGQPIVGAQVFLRDTRLGTVTDVEGAFHLSGIAPGTWELVVRAVGFQEAFRMVNVLSNERLDMNVELHLLEPNATTLLLSPHWRLVSLAPASVSSVIGDERSPYTRTDLTSSDLKKRDAAQDLPYLLRFTPSLVVTSDAGAGVGYTGMRIRGADATRINVTINGVPLNDAESHQVYWVDLPDLGNSAQNIQIQRGVGTSTNGPGAFGATVAVNTLGSDKDAMGRMAFTAGDFGTRRASVQWSTGRGEKGFFLNGRASRIHSDGYVDRATSDLSSLHLTAGKDWNGGQVSYTGLWGHERTYQAWYGVPLVGLTGDSAAILAWAANSYEYGYGEDVERINDLIARGRRHNHYRYENEVDDYTQTHHQLHVDQSIGQWEAGLVLSNTLGSGYYEQFRPDEDLAHYGLMDSLFTVGDVVRRRWLSNAQWGLAGSIQRAFPQGTLQLGGGGYQYTGDHFGRLVWAEHAMGLEPGNTYYDGTGRKRDVNGFVRGMRTAQSGDLRVHGELQLREVAYQVDGTDNDLRLLSVQDDLLFFNPKLGLDYQSSARLRSYVSWSVGNREPSRTDYVDRPAGDLILPERVQDWEVGLDRMEAHWTFHANGYFMDYENQLVLTGDLNDVGAPLRTNVPASYRAGIEMEGRWSFAKGWVWQANLAWSKNRIRTFQEVIFDYDETQPYRQVIDHEAVPIAFSPEWVTTSVLSWEAWTRNQDASNESLQLEWALRHVGAQFLDNTGNVERMLPAYAVNDLRVRWSRSMGEDVLSVSLFVNNALDLEYSSNGWAYSYQYGGPDTRVSEVYVYPQAGRYFSVGLDWSWY